MSSPAPRRTFPPLCWADDEAQSLIAAFKHKWTSLGRTNLKSTDWDDVATTLASQFPLVSPSKTAVQCHNKIEKLRKRFRSEKQRAATRPGRVSPWALYPFLEELESESATKVGLGSGTDRRSRKGEGGSRFLTSLDEFVSVGNGDDDDVGFPVKSLGHRNMMPVFTPNNSHATSNEEFNANVKSKHKKFGVDSRDFGGSSGLMRSVDPVEDMVSSIRMLGEKYMKVEKRKMEMAREIVMMQMDMEMKQTQVVIESQQQMVNVCVTALLDSKKMKKKKRKINAVATDS